MENGKLFHTDVLVKKQFARCLMLAIEVNDMYHMTYYGLLS